MEWDTETVAQTPNLSTTNFPMPRAVQVETSSGPVKAVEYTSLVQTLWRIINDLRAIGNSFQNFPSRPSKTVITNYLMSTADSIIYANAVSGALTVTLPNANAISGQVVTVKKTDASGNTVTVAAVAGQLIDGAATFVIPTQYISVDFQSEGGAYWVI